MFACMTIIFMKIKYRHAVISHTSKHFMEKRNRWFACSLNKAVFALLSSYNWHLHEKLIVAQKQLIDI